MKCNIVMDIVLTWLTDNTRHMKNIGKNNIGIKLNQVLKMAKFLLFYFIPQGLWIEVTEKIFTCERAIVKMSQSIERY